MFNYIYRWSLIAGRLPGRTDNEIKNYWNSRLSKKIHEKEKTVVEASTAQENTMPQKTCSIAHAADGSGTSDQGNFDANDFFDGLEWVNKFLELDDYEDPNNWLLTDKM
ncbi:hypothetical protein SLA2020_272310 [Shorea laevis]